MMMKVVGMKLLNFIRVVMIMNDDGCGFSVDW